MKRLALIPPLALALAAPTVAARPAPVGLSIPPTLVGNAPASILEGPITTPSGPAQVVHPGEAVDTAWWRTFGSPALDALAQQALAANNDIALAQANLKQARELTRAARGALFPQIDAGYQVSRQRTSDMLASPLADPNASLFSLHSAQVSLSYSLDLFGATRARVRSAKAAEKAQAARLAGVRNIIVGNLALAVIQNAALDAQANAARSAIDSNRQILGLLRQRLALGAVGQADVAAQEAALAASEGALPPIERARSANLALISVLTGVAPGAPLPNLPALDGLVLPADLPLSLPSDLVAQRPDVAAAAAAMEGAGADLDAAIKARLPSIMLGATTGGSATAFSDMFKTGNPFWTLLGGLTTPIFHGGTLLHQKHAAEAALAGAQATYRGVALQAFADVSNALTALKTDAAALEAAQRGNAAAQMNFGFMRKQLEIGSVGTLAVLNASATAQQAWSQFVAARAARLSDSVGLFVALGGGQLSAKPEPVLAAPVDTQKQEGSQPSAANALQPGEPKAIIGLADYPSEPSHRGRFGNSTL